MREQSLEKSLTPEQRDQSADLAQRMARAAGKVQPAVMIYACYALMQTAFMAANPDAYIDWRIDIEAKGKGGTHA